MTTKSFKINNRVTGREQTIIDYLSSHENEYIPTRQIAKDVGFDFRSNRDLLSSLYNKMLVHRKRVPFKAKHNGGRRFEHHYKVDLFMVDCLPYNRKASSFTTNIKPMIKIVKKDKSLFNKLFKFKEQ